MLRTYYLVGNSSVALQPTDVWMHLQLSYFRILPCPLLQKLH